MLWLGVDMGGTGTRWALRDADRTTIARGALGGGTGAPDPALRAAFVRTLRNLADALPGAPAGAVLGLTGSGLTPDTDLIAATAQALSLPETCIWVMNDMQLAGHTAFGHAQSGHLIAAGTGSVGLHKAADGQMHIIGGRGILIDDAGSGAWIGLQALKALWRRIEETGAPTGMEGLAAHLARLGRVLIQRFGPAPVVAFGGVFSLHPAVTRAVQDALAPTPITFPALDFAAHAATLAQTRFANQTPFAPEDT